MSDERFQLAVDVVRAVALCAIAASVWRIAEILEKIILYVPAGPPVHL